MDKAEYDYAVEYMDHQLAANQRIHGLPTFRSGELTRNEIAIIIEQRIPHFLDLILAQLK